MKVLITGGAGFIGSALIRKILRNTPWHVVNVDKLTYAGNLRSIQSETEKFSQRYEFRKTDICDRSELEKIFLDHKPDAVFHLAAESHVDRSIDSSDVFIRTNVVGTHTLLEVSLRYWEALPADRKNRFRYLQISTDEVFGSLGPEGHFDHLSPYSPNSPYSASKAGADHLAGSWHRTFGLPTIISHCGNNYGPYQFPEKLIPATIINAVNRRRIPVYGNGGNIRDWVFVDDHVDALIRIFERGTVGSHYCVSGRNEYTNIRIVEKICSILDRVLPNQGFSYSSLISFVEDRRGHDRRYAISPDQMKNELDWSAQVAFDAGIEKTVAWYLENETWWKKVTGTKEITRLGTKQIAPLILKPRPRKLLSQTNTTKGIILAGGSGTRLRPTTLAVNKHLIPVFDKPIIYYPLATLIQAGIRDIALITSPDCTEAYQALLGDGSRFNIQLQYLTQERPEGIAQAFLLAENFIDNSPVVLILGDNIFDGIDLEKSLKMAQRKETSALVFGVRVSDPERFGVAQINRKGEIVGLVEKPEKPVSNIAVTGLYYYGAGVVDVAKSLTPSPRGELEITDLNRKYLEKNCLSLEMLGKGAKWLDAGTPESLFEASKYVRLVFTRDVRLIGSPEEAAWRNGFISSEDLQKLAQEPGKTEYERHLSNLAAKKTKKTA